MEDGLGDKVEDKDTLGDKTGEDDNLNDRGEMVEEGSFVARSEESCEECKSTTEARPPVGNTLVSASDTRDVSSCKRAKSCTK